MLRLALAAALASVLALPTAAQYETFRPLHVGNEWVYSLQGYSGYSYEACVAPEFATRNYVKLRVTADTTRAGAPARMIECTLFDAAGSSVTGFGTLVAPLSYSNAGGYTDDGAWCAFAFRTSNPYGIPLPIPARPPSEPISIGGVPYQPSEVSDFSITPRVAMLRSREFQFWADIVGFVRGGYESWDRHGPNHICSGTQSVLESATIDGEVFGVSPVGAGSAPSAPVPVALRAFPSPAAAAVTLEGAAGEVAVFDLLGRRVARLDATAGQDLRLDVSAWPAGLYVVRSLSEGEAQTARFVVAR